MAIQKSGKRGANGNVRRIVADEWLPVSSHNALADAESVSIDVEIQRTGSPDLDAVLETAGRRGVWLLRLELLFANRWDWLSREFGREQDRGTPFLWAPVCFGSGCLVYFSLPREPLLGAFLVLMLVCILAAWRVGRERSIWFFLIGLALVSSGASMAQIHASWINTPMMSRTVVADVSGLVQSVEIRANGRVRYTLDTSNDAGEVRFRGAGNRPVLIRLTARSSGGIARVGDIISGKVRLGPPSGPAFPGAYDFSFQNWFDGIGGTGFFLGNPRVTGSPLVLATFSLGLSSVRSGISALIREALPGRGGSLAAALIVGDRSGIDKETAEALRRSGLAHILAISGLHMALVSATVVVAMRFFFALFPVVSLHYPVKKWSAACALAAATGYLLLSGASVSTQRAFVMIAIMLFAVLIDRRALTMRNVALAAMVVLIISPESVLSPGFQMSFAAVAALIATYSALTDRARTLMKQPPANVFARIALKAGRNVGGLALTSVVAGLATGLFAAYHFHRVAPFGLLANLLAMPVVSLMVMPLALLSTIAMPFGLEYWPLQWMDQSIAPVISTAEWVAGIEPAGNTGYVSPLTVIFGAMALITATLLKSGLRLLALPLALIAALGIGKVWRPDILILANGRQIAILDERGGMKLLRPRADKFSTNIWKRAFWPHLLAYGTKNGTKNSGDVKTAQRKSGFNCDHFGCSVTTKGVVVTHISNTAMLIEDCLLADLIIVPYAIPDACSFLPVAERPIVIDRTVLERHGAQAITIAKARAKQTNKAAQRLTVTTSYAASPRPWTQHRFDSER